MLFVLSALLCPAVPFVANSNPSTYRRHYGTHVYYTCFEGFWFPDIRNNGKLIECDSEGNWTGGLIGDCQGTYYIHVHIIYVHYGEDGEARTSDIKCYNG